MWHIDIDVKKGVGRVAKVVSCMLPPPFTGDI